MDEVCSFEIWQSLLACHFLLPVLCSLVAVKCHQTAFIWCSLSYTNHIRM